MPVCGNYLFFELPKKIVLNPKDGWHTAQAPETGRKAGSLFCARSRRCSGSCLRVLQSAWTVGSVKTFFENEAKLPGNLLTFADKASKIVW